jgi:RNA polymerase sigma-70 factor (ECF subfamily)
MAEPDPCSQTQRLEAHRLKVQSLFVQYQPQIRNLIHSVQPRFVAADDLLQECFLTVTAKANEFEMGSNFLAWVRAILRFKVLSLQREAMRQPEILAADVLESLLAEAPDPLQPDADLGVQQAIRQCLERLAPAAREIVRMRYFLQHGPVEIARLRDSSVNAINVTLARARDALRRCVEIQTLSS